ncbi:interleukin-36 alpha-like [Pantherophis guttatus]|uniref:Interleukin-36 alpha-like n=1 Tax=Pantherophis guttatus TaxID=94885 RepID=A0A6P9DKE6_PANGU|nr:interleukin-36 alpha-like [Pantherophis guttatus]
MGDNKLVASPNDSNSKEQLIAVLPNNALDQWSGDIMYLYKQNEKFLNFSFYSKTDGSRDTCSFESAQFPGWFLSTSSEAHQPIGLSQKGGPENILFHFQRIY